MSLASTAMLALALQQVPIVSEPGWDLMGAREGYIYFLDPASIRNVGSRVSIRTRLLGSFGNVPAARSAIVIVELDCSAHTGTIVEARYFDVGGALLESRLIEPGARRAVATDPDTPEEAIETRACAAAGSPIA